MRAYVTGGSGAIGRRLVADLRRKGLAVSCLVRDPARCADLFGAQLIRGDILDAKRLAETIPGHDLVFHLAGYFAIGVSRAEAVQMARVNIEGTHNVLLAAWQAGVTRIVHCSSIGALGSSGPPAARATELHPHDGRFHCAYVRTKYKGHMVARTLAARGAPLVIAMPGAAFGPGVRGTVQQNMRLIAERRVSSIPSVSGIHSYTHVDDIVEGLWLAATRGRIGEEYILAGPPLPLKEFYQTVARAAGVPPPRWALSPRIVRAVSFVYEHLPGAKRLLPNRPYSKEHVAMVLDANWAVSSAKAAHELGWHARTLEDGLGDFAVSAPP